MYVGYATANSLCGEVLMAAQADKVLLRFEYRYIFLLLQFLAVHQPGNQDYSQNNQSGVIQMEGYDEDEVNDKNKQGSQHYHRKGRCSRRLTVVFKRQTIAGTAVGAMYNRLIHSAPLFHLPFPSLSFFLLPVYSLRPRTGIYSVKRFSGSAFSICSEKIFIFESRRSIRWRA